MFSASHRGGSGPPIVCIHGFTDTWRSWELILPRLEREHDVLAPTLRGHAGGDQLPERIEHGTLADGVEAAMDAAGFETAHIVGNSLGGYTALQLAARGRARSVVALAPAGGWAAGDESYKETLGYFIAMQKQLKFVAPQAHKFLSTPEGRRRATKFIAETYEHIPAELLEHQLMGVVRCEVVPLVEFARREGYDLDAEKITCPVRVVWGTRDRLLSWPDTATRYKSDWLPTADWVELDGVGHCPQLDVPLETSELITDFVAAAS
jgi:pimeloyl-ACP methyl ester carboxylesterase